MKELIPIVFESLKTSNSKDLIKEYTEQAIDSLIKSDAVKQIPLVNIIVDTVGVVNSIRDYLFVKKVCGFLSRASDVPDDIKMAFLDDLDNDLKLKIKVGEQVLLFLEQADDVDKSIISGCVFQAYIKGSISYSEMSLMLSGINKVPYEHLTIYMNSGNLQDEERISLFFSGFMSPTYISADPLVIASYEDTKLGKKFKKIIAAST